MPHQNPSHPDISDMRTLIISEIGINHNGDFKTAKKLIGASNDAGADLIKFQTYFGKFPDLRHVEFSQDEWKELFAYCTHLGKQWISTPFDGPAVEFLDELGQQTWKIPSNPAVVKNYPLLKKIAKLENCKMVFLSTGISSDSEIKETLKIFKHKNLILFHCVSKYPTPIEDVNLHRICKLEEKFGVPVGFSDHSMSVSIPVQAVKVGAIAIEKHITLSRDMDGPDHMASLEPNEFKQMVKQIRWHERNL